MKVFISWSGSRSKAVAQTLHQWLPDVIQSVDPWMSAEDIEAGARWSSEIANELEDARFGIICLTQDNQTKPWILFEAGALAKTLKNTYVCPYLIDLAPAELQSGPLTQFHAKRADKAQTLELVQTINRVLGDEALQDDRLHRLFERCWPELEQSLGNLPEPEGNQQPKRSVEDMIKEVLELVRQIARFPQVVTPEPARAVVGTRLRDIGQIENPNLVLRQTSPQVVVPPEKITEGSVSE